MSEPTHDYLPILTASAVFIGDLIGAIILFFVLRSRATKGLAVLIPILVLFSGVIAAVVIYFSLSR